jgi:hypothetical protein
MGGILRLARGRRRFVRTQHGNVNAVPASFPARRIEFVNVDPTAPPPSFVPDCVLRQRPFRKGLSGLVVSGPRACIVIAQIQVAIANEAVDCDEIVRLVTIEDAWET